MILSILALYLELFLNWGLRPDDSAKSTELHEPGLLETGTASFQTRGMRGAARDAAGWTGLTLQRGRKAVCTPCVSDPGRLMPSARGRTLTASVFVPAQSSLTAGDAKSSPAHLAGCLSLNGLFGQIGGVFASSSAPKIRQPSRYSPR